jgi:PST family polysaccharide transporter
MSILKWQTISLISKISSILMGLVGTIIVLRVLSPSDWGVVGLATSIVGTVSVLQHLGLANGLNRAIAHEKNPPNIPTIIFTALIIRLPVSLVIALIMTLAAGYIATTFYQNNDLIFPIQLLATLVIIEGVQDIFSTSVGALKLFKGLFLFQVVLAMVYLAANIVGVTQFGLPGYFYAKYLYMGASFLVFGAVLTRHFYKQAVNVLAIKFSRIRYYIGQITGIGSASFIQKIILIYWQKLPTLVMGTMFSAALIGAYNFADFFSQRLTIFSDAASDVTLPVFLRSFEENFEQFRKDFINNFLRVGVITMLCMVATGLFIPEFLKITGLNKYQGVQSIFIVSAFGSLLYSLLNTIGVIFVAADARKHLITAFVFVFLTTFVCIYPLSNQWGVLGGALAYALGALSGFVYYFVALRRLYKITLIQIQHIYLFSPLLLLLFAPWPLITKVSMCLLALVLYVWLLKTHHREIYEMITRKLGIK